MRNYGAMLCHIETPDEFPGEGWTLEPKIDGWRFLFWRTTAGSPVKVRSYSGRNGEERTGQALLIEHALEWLPPDTILDAELYVPFEKAARVSHHLAHGSTSLQAVLFDVLRVAGEDVTKDPLHRRRMFLDRMVELDSLNTDFVTVAEVETDPTRFDIAHEAWLEAGFEGSVAKRADSFYRPGKRSADWRKFKPRETVDAIVRGWEYGKGASNQQQCGALEIELLDEDGVPNGVHTTVGHHTTPILANELIGRTIEIKYQYLNDSGKPRHGVFGRLREDLEPVA